MIKEKVREAPLTVNETVFRHLKKAIIEGDLKPGQRIQEKEIARIFHVSTTPTREAFQRLAAEGYLTINARREVSIASLSVEEIKEVYEVVRALDILATKKAVENLNPKDIEDLKKINEDLGDYIKQNNIASYIKQNLKVHFRIWKNCGNKFLIKSLFDLGDKLFFFSNQIFAKIDNPAIFEKSIKEHFELVGAIEKRDTAAIEKIILSHWGGVGFL
ncbi:MAG: GntR family transcriptional regulator [Candidatus Aminicenantes bacterium]|nr:GntR family transcriptional regulator [Candidatus Aminicenantes bacterium]